MASGGGILLGILALTLMAVPLLAFVGVLAAMQGIQNATTNATLLIALTNAIADVLVKISIVAPLAILGVAAITALTGFMLGVGALAVAIGALMETFPSLEDFIDTGLPMLSKLAYGVGDMIGSFIAGFSEALISGLPEIALSLSNFMINLTPFIMGAKLIDDQVFKGVGILTASILALAAADFIAGIESFLTIGSISQLGSELSAFMINLTPFIVGAKMLDNTILEGVKALTSTILVLTAADILDGITSWITGESSISKFANQLAPFGASLLAFSISVQGISIENITTAIDAINALAGMANSDELKSAGNAIEKMIDVLQDTSKVKADSVDGFATALSKIAQNSVDALISSFKDMHPKANEEGKALMDEAINGIASKKDDVKNAGIDVVSNAAAAIESQDQYAKFKKAGAYLGDGLIEGINSKKKAVYNSAFDLGTLAVLGEKKGQDSNSPSKLTIKAGKWLGEGLVIGMQKLSHSVYQSGYNLGETATDAISSTISRMSDVFNSDIDTQPTIRPVLDLSNISAGAGTINRMFGTNPSIGVLTKVGSISSMMNSQNGTDKEVISAIKDLGRKLDDKSGDIYNFGDFTYDDSSNVSDAVRTLVRAVKIEGRR